jgi:hypothetical protein
MIQNFFRLGGLQYPALGHSAAELEADSNEDVVIY